MKNYIESYMDCNVVILPTKMGAYRHLYFISDKEIVRKGDIVLNYSRTEVFIAEGYLGHGYIKVIASTDQSLGLPGIRIPEKWIKKYIAADGKIDKIQLKTIIRRNPNTTPRWNNNWVEKILVLTPQNEVTVLDYSESPDAHEGFTDCFKQPTEGHILMTDGGSDNVGFEVPISSFKKDQERESDEGYKKFLNNPEEYIEKTRSVDPIKVALKMREKELDDAAIKYSDGNSLEFSYMQEIPAFKAGANWQKQQSANDTIEFVTKFVLEEFGVTVDERVLNSYELWVKNK